MSNISNSRIFFTSDTHYFHKNIAGPKVSKWKSGYRDFEDEKEMSRHIVKIFNEIVAEDDILYHLGDWSFGGIENIWNFRKQLRCKNIHLCYGNHDNHIINNKDIPENQFEESFNWSQYSRKEELDFKLQDLFQSTQDTIEVKHRKHKFFMSHYKHAVWPSNNKGVIHLYGHSHSSAEGWKIGKSMDVGIDNAKKLLGEYKPFSIEEVISIMDKIEIKKVDHHH